MWKKEGVRCEHDREDNEQSVCMCAGTQRIRDNKYISGNIRANHFHLAKTFNGVFFLYSGCFSMAVHVWRICYCYCDSYRTGPRNLLNWFFFLLFARMFHRVGEMNTISITFLPCIR